MNIDEFRNIIKERNRISVETQDEWAYGIEKCWEEEIRILSEDINSTIDYLKNDCTAEEFSWISEIIDDLAEKTHSLDLISNYKELMNFYPEECNKYNIVYSIECAENILKEGDTSENKQA